MSRTTTEATNRSSAGDLAIEGLSLLPGWSGALTEPLFHLPVRPVVRAARTWRVALRATFIGVIWNGANLSNYGAPPGPPG